MKSILLVLRDAAKNCADEHLRQHLRDLADEMNGYLCRMTATPCADTMQQVNGCFARAMVALPMAQMPAPPQGGAMPITEEQKAA
jgi:hypothetical protein